MIYCELVFSSLFVQNIYVAGLLLIKHMNLAFYSATSLQLSYNVEFWDVYVCDINGWLEEKTLILQLQNLTIFGWQMRYHRLVKGGRGAHKWDIRQQEEIYAKVQIIRGYYLHQTLIGGTG